MNNRNLSDFELSDYEDYGEEPIEEHISENEPVQIKKISSKEIRDKDFQLSDYEEYTPQKQEYPSGFSYLTPEQQKITGEETKKLSLEERMQLVEDLKREREYKQSKGFTKGVLSGATLGFSEKIPGLKPKEGEYASGLGQALGAALPIGLTGKIVSIPLKMSGLMDYGLGRIGSSVLTGAAYSLEKQAVKGEGIDPLEVAEEAATFGILHGLFEGIPKAYNWIKSLNVKQQAQALVDGVIPTDLTPNQYKFYENEIVPELQKMGQQKYQEALQEAIEVNEKEFAQKMANVRADHENDLFKRSQKQKLNQEDYDQAKLDYQNKLKQVAAEHEAKVEEIQKQNQIAQEQFQKDKQDFEIMKRRQQAVQDAIKPKESEIDLKGRVREQGEDIGFRPSPGIEQDPSLRNKVGSIFSKNTVKSESEAGLENVKAIRANDNIDYQIVREAYDLSDKLSETVQTEHSGLALEMVRLIDELNKIPELSPPRKQLLTIAQKILSKIGIFNEEGVLIGFNKISNKVLQDQAKELRYFMDFNFEHGNTRGIFSPMVSTLEDAAELAATSTNNKQAYEASKNARRLYRQWAEDYDNDYIRPFRDTKNYDYIKLFNETLNPDIYPVVDNILYRSNAGQQISAANKRALIEKELKPFFSNRGKIDPEKFEDSLKKIRGVITPEQEKSIVEEFAKERRKSSIIAKKSEMPKSVKEPKLKEIPRAEIPLFKEKLKKVPEIESVKIPLKPEVKISPAMREAEKLMKITPEEAISMTNSPTGLKKLKSNLPDKLFEKLGKEKIKDIFQQGKISKKFTGKELYDVINNGENYALISEILGEDTAAELLVNSREIASKQATVDTFKKVGTKIGTLKTLIAFGIL
jgi:hypothetical protein